MLLVIRSKFNALHEDEVLQFNLEADIPSASLKPGFADHLFESCSISHFASGRHKMVRTGNEKADDNCKWRET